MLGLYSVNCKEWVLLDAAAHAYSMVSVPLYDTLGPDAVEFISNHAELAAVGCSAAVLPTLMSCLHKCPSVKLLVSGGWVGAVGVGVAVSFVGFWSWGVRV
jgi:long-chain acyl-CoA synthetase